MPAAFAYTYDANGAVHTRTEGATTYTHGYDVQGRQTSVAVAGGATSRFVYNGDGELVARQVAGRTVAHYAAGGLYEADPATSTTRKYAPFGGWRVAVTTTTGPPPQTVTTVQYLHQDHLGSSSLVTTAAGALAQARFHAPFGAPWYTPTAAAAAVASTLGTRFGEPWPAAGTQQATPAATDRHYTGQRSFEASLGSLYHYQARWYSPVLGRFLSPDPIVPNPTNPQALNRYSYVYNNPLRYLDPTGYEPVYGHYRDPGGSGELWYGWYDDELDPTDRVWHGERKVADGLHRPLVDGVFVTCEGSSCTAWKEHWSMNNGGSWSMRRAGAEDIYGPTYKRIEIPRDKKTGKQVNILTNIQIALDQKGRLIWFYHQVKPEGPWDYKLQGKGLEFEPYGNYHYGAVGWALGVSADNLLRAAGAAQVKGYIEGKSPLGSGRPFDPPGLGSCYGDECRDQDNIRLGIQYFEDIMNFARRIARRINLGLR